MTVNNQQKRRQCLSLGNVISNDDQVKQPALNGRECEGFCLENDAVNSSAIVKYTCVLKDNIPNWETPDGALITIDDVKLTAERANETECIASCEDIKEKDPGSLFKWNCTLKVIITII